MYVFVYISTCTCLCVRARYVKDVELIEFPIINNNSILNGQQKRQQQFIVYQNGVCVCAAYTAHAIFFRNHPCETARG